MLAEETFRFPSSFLAARTSSSFDKRASISNAECFVGECDLLRVGSFCGEVGAKREEVRGFGSGGWWAPDIASFD